MATPALMQTHKSPEVHDVVIIGSGAAGGMAAWNLTRQGMRVLMLDAGAKFERSQFWSHVKPWQAPQKLAAGQKPPQFYVDLKTAPYQTHEGLNLTPRTGTFYLAPPFAVSSTTTESTASGALAGRVTLTLPPVCFIFNAACWASASRYAFFTLPSTLESSKAPLGHVKR